MDSENTRMITIPKNQNNDDNQKAIDEKCNQAEDKMVIRKMLMMMFMLLRRL